MTVANSPVQLFIFDIFEHKWGTRKHIGDLKKYSWCIPVQKEIKPIIWGAAITPEPWNRQQCWFIFEDPNVRVARLSKNMSFYPPTQRSCWVVYWFHPVSPSVRLSVRLSVHLSFLPSVRSASRVCFVAPTVLVGSISYSYILSSNFRRCVACNVSSKIWNFGIFFKFITLTLSSVDLEYHVNH